MNHIKGHQREKNENSGLLFDLQNPHTPPTYRLVSDRLPAYVPKQKHGATYPFGNRIHIDVQRSP